MALTNQTDITFHLSTSKVGSKVEETATVEAWIGNTSEMTGAQIEEELETAWVDWKDNHMIGGWHGLGEITFHVATGMSGSKVEDTADVEHWIGDTEHLSMRQVREQLEVAWSEWKDNFLAGGWYEGRP